MGIRHAKAHTLQGLVFDEARANDRLGKVKTHVLPLCQSFLAKAEIVVQKPCNHPLNCGTPPRSLAHVQDLVLAISSPINRWQGPQGLRNANHTKTLDLADIYGRFVYKENLISKRFPETKKALITGPSADMRTMSNSSLVSNGFQPKFTPKLIQSSQQTQSSQNEPKIQKDYKAEYKKMKAKLALLEASPSTSQSPKPFLSKNKGLVAETFDWDEEKVSDDEEIIQVKVLMALANGELPVGKNHAMNGEWIDITMRKVNILLSMDEDSDWKNYLKYINIDLKFVEEQRLNLLSKYNKNLFELNKCRDDLLVLKQAKLDAANFQIQNTKLTKLNHALQEQLKKERNGNEKWLNSSNKLSQCISEQISNQKKKILRIEQLTESSSKNDVKENLFIHASLDHDHEMILKSKDCVERHNPDNKLPNFNIGRILVPES
ncbi:hypothetical protein Tco_1174500 [Tanacetum coccineum]